MNPTVLRVLLIGREIKYCHHIVSAIVVFAAARNFQSELVLTLALLAGNISEIASVRTTLNCRLCLQ